MKRLILAGGLLLSIYSHGQNVGINATGATPNTSAALDIDMSDKGLLIPRIALTSANTFAPVTGTPATSLLIYNTATAGTAPNNVTPGFYFWNGSLWTRMAAQKEVAIAGDVKQGFQTADHSGWILLDGRAIGTLTSTQQAAASALGFSGNLPNASGKTLKMQGSPGTTGGASTVTIAQSNLPNFNMSATSTTGGSHSHTGTTASSGDHNHTHTDYYYAENNGTNWGWAGSSSGMDWDNRGYSTTGTTSTNGAHTHTFTTSTDSGHTHSVTVNSGGGGVALNVENPYLSTNTFIYLGY